MTPTIYSKNEGPRVDLETPPPVVRYLACPECLNPEALKLVGIWPENSNYAFDVASFCKNCREGNTKEILNSEA